MKILAIEQECPGISPDQFQALSESEAWKVWEMQKEGFIRECYFKKDENIAVLILEAKNVKEVKRRLFELPFVKHHLITFDIIPLRPYPGLRRLFKSQSGEEEIING